MSNILNETTFEEHIANCLANSDLYNQRTSQDFDIETLCDREMLEQFLRQQTATWQMLERSFPGHETDTVIREFNNKLDRGESMLTLFRRTARLTGSIAPIGSALCGRCTTVRLMPTRVTSWTCASCSTACHSSPSN